MNRMLSIPLTFAFSFGCSALLAASSSSDTISPPTQSPAVADAKPDTEKHPVAVSDPSQPQPWLCDLEDGKWCQGCGTGPCPQGDEGWLCCVGNICVAVKYYSDCTTGVAGWCNNYTETTSPAGNTTATCHD